MIQVARQAFVRTLEYGDAIGQDETVGDTSFGQGPSFIQAKQAALRRTAQVANLALRRFALHNHGEVAHPGAEPPGEFGQSLFDQRIEFARTHPITCYHISQGWWVKLNSS